MKLSSPAFENNGEIPSKYTCDGESINPPLKISGVPEGANSLVLILEDPDVPKQYKPDGVYDHLVVFNIPTSTVSVGEGQNVPGIYGLNSSGTTKYVGPCPPDREHRYIFSLYALDSKLDLGAGATKREIISAMNGHIMDETRLTGLYDRKK